MSEVKSSLRVQVVSNALINEAAALEGNNTTILMNAVAIACRNAAIQTGFTNIEVGEGIRQDIRVIATDVVGRTLVNEIHITPQGQVGLRTEVINAIDDSCANIQDAFDEALVNVGVRMTQSSRKWTGGVYELAATREFLRRKIHRAAPVSAAKAANNQESRRAQRLNARNVDHLRRRCG